MSAACGAQAAAEGRAAAAGGFRPSVRAGRGALLPMQVRSRHLRESRSGRVVGMIDGGVASHPSLAGASNRAERFRRVAAADRTRHRRCFAAGRQPGTLSRRRDGRATVCRRRLRRQPRGRLRNGYRPRARLARQSPPAGDQHQPGRPAEQARRSARSRPFRRAASRSSRQSAMTARPLRRNIPHLIQGSSQSPLSMGAAARCLRRASRHTSISRRQARTWRQRCLGEAMRRYAGPASPPHSPRPGCCSPGRLHGSLPKRAPAEGRVGRGIVCGECRVDPRSVGAK